jgi:K+-transporting ATPase c subunit
MRLPSWIAQHLAALRALLVFTVVLGLAYPFTLVAVARVPGLADKAQGSLVSGVDGHPVGSKIIGQLFVDPDGNPLPQYFQTRPSAAGDGYDPTSTSASNLGPESIGGAPWRFLVRSTRKAPRTKEAKVCSPRFARAASRLASWRVLTVAACSAPAMASGRCCGCSAARA